MYNLFIKKCGSRGRIHF